MLENYHPPAALTTADRANCAAAQARAVRRSQISQLVSRLGNPFTF